MKTLIVVSNSLSPNPFENRNQCHHRSAKRAKQCINFDSSLGIYGEKIQALLIRSAVSL